MKLNSIHVGQPREVEYHGKTITTSIFKEEISGPVNVGKLNIEGDKQADLMVHGGVEKAVYAYPIEHYEYWKEIRSDLKYSPGVFGENLSVSGMNEKTVCVGDVYRIGSVLFSVTIPRMPCFKLGIKMGDPTIIKDFMKSERSGFYLQVLEEGVIEAGQEIIKEGSDGYALTIEEMVRLDASGKSDQELLKRAIGSPSMSQERRDKYEVKLAQLEKN